MYHREQIFYNMMWFFFVNVPIHFFEEELNFGEMRFFDIKLILIIHI